MYTPSKSIIDNSNLKLFEELKKILDEQKNVDIASGYFNLGGYELIQKELNKVNKLRLLLGKQPDFSSDSVPDVLDFYNGSLRKSFEKEKFDRKKEITAQSLIDLLKSKKIEVRLYEKSFLHGKAYIFDNLVITGSSNFTYAGLTNNTELNAVLSDVYSQYVRKEWFEKFWAESKDFKKQLIEILEKSKFGSKTTPFEVYIKALFELQKDDVIIDVREKEEAEESRVNLAEFQEDAVRRVMTRMRKYNGVLVADSVGLGKTFIAKKVLEEFGYYRRKNFLVICPAQIRETIWRPELKDLGISENIISQEDIGTEYFYDKVAYAVGGNEKIEKIALFVIDESHNFRNPLSNRYEGIFTIIEKATTKNNKPKILLLTATPINNSFWDLYFQLMLIARNNDKIFVRENIPSLQNFFRKIEREGDTSILDDILHEISIRRPRQYIIENYPDAEINGEKIIFPERKLEPINYKLDALYKGLYSDISDKIENQLTMAYYKLEEYLILGERDEFELGRMMALSGIYKTILLKRLESSVEAFKLSLTNQINFLKKFKEFFNQRKILKKTIYNKYISALTEGEENSEIIEEFESNLEDINFSKYDVQKFRKDLETDIAIFDDMLDIVADIKEQDDSKLNEFKDKLLELKNEGKILVFSYYTDTVKYIHSALQKDKKFMSSFGHKIDLIYGVFTPDQRRKKVDDFLNEDVDLLISTDVLSEGQNLQKARILINYDLHWNPVRMIQRAGRIDRIGSPFKEIFVYNFFPEDELETLLRLVQRLQQKINYINNSIGLDTSVLGEIINPKVFGAIKTMSEGTEVEKKKLLDELEKEQFGGSEKFWEPLRKFIITNGISKIEEIPDGVRSGFKRGIRGVFFYFKYEEDYNLWYFYDIIHNRYITNKSQILDFISCKENEPRFVSKDIDIYELYEKIKEEIKNSYNDWQYTAIQQTSKRDEKMVRDIVNELDYIKNETIEKYSEEKERIEKIENMLEKIEKISFTKRRWQTLRKIWNDYKNGHKNWKKLEKELSDFLEGKKIFEKQEYEEFDEKLLRLICIDILT
jgi:ERCC4-related helicase